MKTNSNLLLNTIRILLNIIWVLNFVFIAVAFTFLTIKFCTSGYVEVVAPVKYTSQKVSITMTSLTEDAKDIILTKDQGTLTMQLKNTVWNIFAAYFFFISYEVVVTIIIYQLRKFFDTLKGNTPFKYDNIKRLKVIALCFALVTLINVLLGMDTAWLLKSHIKNFTELNLVWEESFIELILGAVIYVMADVFKHGFNLQKENEEFV